MTEPLTDAEARQVMVCPDCGHPWQYHRGSGASCPFTSWGERCRCTRDDETLAQVAALKAEWQAQADV